MNVFIFFFFAMLCVGVKQNSRNQNTIKKEMRIKSFKQTQVEKKMSANAQAKLFETNGRAIV